MEQFAESALSKAPFMVIPLAALLACLWAFLRYIERMHSEHNAERTRAAIALEKLSGEVIQANTMQMGRVCAALDRADRSKST